MTHPFHPLNGRRFQLVVHARSWGEDRVYFYEDEGPLKSLPASWTSVGEVDPFVMLSEGRALFRPAELLKLADLLAELGERPKKSGVGGAEGA